MSFGIQPSPEIYSRVQFGDLLNARGIRRNAVEVGTDRGGFAFEFLSRWKGDCLFCVDNYLPYDEMPWEREADRLLATHHLAPFAPRIRMVLADSVAAVGQLASYPAEFVYVDANHSKPQVERDLRIWWVHLYPVGPTILAGHDFDEDHPEVMGAVTEFAREQDRTIYTTREGDTPPSWYIYRNEPEFLCRLHST